MATSTLDQTGLTIESLNDIIADLVAGYQSIYGADINVNSNSPDGQLINIYAQSISDLLQFLQAIYASFDPDTAYGVQLDQRVAINGLTRKQGTYTLAYVAITTSQALTLYGQDQSTQTIFTVADAQGNQFQLMTTTVFGGAGTQTLAFQAVAIGQVETTANTITNQVTSTLGVTTVNNPSTSNDVIGVNEETDAQLRVRHQQMFALAATSPADSVEAAILEIPDVIDALVWENYTGSTDATGTLAHSIWCIVRGGQASEIGQAIYAKKGPGCGMRGAVSTNIARPNGTVFTAAWDTAIAQTLYIRFTINPINSSVNFSGPTLAAALAAALSYRLNQVATIGQVITAMLAIAPNGYLTVPGVSVDNISFLGSVPATSPAYYFTVAAANINITVA